jgi:hypothetical protein
MRRAKVAALAAVLGATPALADASWLTARGRLLDAARAEVWGGPRTIGLGVVVPDGPDARAGLAAELAWSFIDRTAELRGSRQWQFTQTGFATGSATLGVSGIVVPEGSFDLGIGPHAGLTLSLGGDTFTVDLGLQTGFELFVKQEGPRLPQRALVGLNLRLAHFTMAVMARIGVDLQPGRSMAGRGEFVVSVGWLPDWLKRK